MTIEERLFKDMTAAVKAKDKIRLDTIRMLRAKLKDARIQKMADLNESEIEQVLTTAVKQRKEAIELFKKGSRDDLVNKEQAELDIIYSYLPEQLSGEEIETIISETIKSLKATSEKDLGRVMSNIIPRIKGKADGKLIQQKVRELLSKLTS
jgi:uncharacterized protein YqeY